MNNQTNPKGHPLNKYGKQMRKLHRGIARANMEKHGAVRINKKRRTQDGKTTSFFATNWRRYVLFN